jgi:hypothetical protein
MVAVHLVAGTSAPPRRDTRGQHSGASPPMSIAGGEGHDAPQTGESWRPLPEKAAKRKIPISRAVRKRDSGLRTRGFACRHQFTASEIEKLSLQILYPPGGDASFYPRKDDGDGVSDLDLI